MKPILFKTAMIRAILDGRKTVTRRPIKPQPRNIVPDAKNRRPLAFWVDNTKWVKPPYQPGDILYVRETWALVPDESNDPIYRWCYKADHEDRPIERWRPSIHMPREAARIFLRVTDVQVERLRDINETGAEKEGLQYYDDVCQDENWHPTFYDPDSGGDPSTVAGFSKLWDSTIKPANRALYGWDANPWVWVIAFERCEKPEGGTE